MSELIHSIQSMPLAGLVPAGLLLMAGAVMWLAGRRLLRGAFMMMGLMLGALVGLLMSDSSEGGMPGWVLPVLGAVVLAVTAALTYRLAAAVMMAIVLGLACPLTVIAVNELQVQRGAGITNDNDDQIEVKDSISDTIARHQTELDHAASALNDLNDKATQRIQDVAAKHGLEQEAAAGIEKVKSFGTALADSIKQRWSDTPKRLRPTLSLSALIGALSGLIFGLIARRFSDCAVTAMVGAATWLGAANVIAVRAGAPDGPWMPHSTLAWMSLWTVVSVIGLAVQWARKPKPADKPA